VTRLICVRPGGVSSHHRTIHVGTVVQFVSRSTTVHGAIWVKFADGCTELVSPTYFEELG
jgi:hypothetical protein